jgi:hypothetical protein
MTKKDKDEIERLSRLKEASVGDKDSCERLINTYINVGYKFCKTCAPAVRSAFNLLRNWWANQNQGTYQFIKEIDKDKR